MRTPKYQEIVDSYPGYGPVCSGGLKRAALEVVKEYEDLYKFPKFKGMSDAEIKGRILRKKAFDEDSEIMDRLTHAVNGGNYKDIAKAMYLGLCNQHRTLQAQAIKAILELLRIYKDSDYDLRNHAAVVESALVTEFLDKEGFGIPFI